MALIAGSMVSNPGVWAAGYRRYRLQKSFARSIRRGCEPVRHEKPTG